ncbi:reverse transcriptase domain-containing protein [Rhizobium leguminosarum]|uniref:reverse transcriptase domain-containing protein n=1 Tax=Rhizobium leguminosarum TaxID=384 RepID=UPI00037FCEC3|nr:reverse transcriptase domain-containing protein [Rhizobium leguminosarum]
MTSPPPYFFPDYVKDHPDFVAEVFRHEGRKEAALRRIAQTSNRDKQRLLILRFLGDRNLKLLYLLKSVQAKRRLSTHPPETMRELAGRMTATYHFTEHVRMKTVQPAPHKRRRTTYDFGPGKHALQSMVADVIRAMFPLPSGRHFTLNGGVKAALKAVNEHAQQGFVHGIERDIEHFYPSVNLEGLATLLRPLPGSVVRNVIGYMHGDTGSTDIHPAEAIDDAPLPPRGLLAQGSAASPAAAEVLVANLLQGMPDDVCVMSYADNILILGENISSVEAADAFLVGRASDYEYGSLGLKQRKQCVITDPSGINFVGHDGYWNGERIQWMPDIAATNHILQAIELSTDEREGALDRVRDAIQHLHHWRRGYVWEDGNEETERYIAQLWAKLAFNAPRLSREYIRAMRSVTAYCQRHHKRHGEYPDIADLLPDFADPHERFGKRPTFIRDIEQRLGIFVVDEERAT